MKKLLFVCAAIAVAFALTPAASASPFSSGFILNHFVDTVTLVSEDPADQGPGYLINQYIVNTGGGSAHGDSEELVITGFEFFLGGSKVSDAAMDNPTQFMGEGNGWTYSVAAGDLTPGGSGTYASPTSPWTVNSSLAGSSWSKNRTPKIGHAVDPEDNSTKNYVTHVSLYDTLNNPSGFCWVGEELGPGDGCVIALQMTPKYGGAMGSSDNTFVYGFATGVEGAGRYDASTQSFKYDTTYVDNAMKEDIQLVVAPEPRSLALLGSGFGMLGALVFLRRRRGADQIVMNQLTAA